MPKGWIILQNSIEYLHSVYSISQMTADRKAMELMDALQWEIIKELNKMTREQKQTRRNGAKRKQFERMPV